MRSGGTKTVHGFVLTPSPSTIPKAACRSLQAPRSFPASTTWGSISLPGSRNSAPVPKVTREERPVADACRPFSGDGDALQRPSAICSARSRAHHPVMARSALNASGDTLRVLVVEDDGDTAESLRALLDLC